MAIYLLQSEQVVIAVQKKYAAQLHIFYLNIYHEKLKQEYRISSHIIHIKLQALYHLFRLQRLYHAHKVAFQNQP